jgi:hypothetical protein
MVFHRQFAACTVSSSLVFGNEERLLAFGGTTRVNHCKAVLLSFGDDKVPVM